MCPLNITIATIFPDLFPGPLSASLLGKAMEKSIWQLNIVDIKTFGKTIDDKVFGGFPGMIIKPQIIEGLMNSFDCLWNKILYTSPAGRKLNQNFLYEILNEIKVSKYESYNILIICGRYEGIDARAIDYYKMEEFSLGDFVLCGGEIPAMALVEGLVRLIPGVIGNALSLEEESFSKENYTQYKKYTRPRVWKDKEVPSILFSGNHGHIKKWTENN